MGKRWAEHFRSNVVAYVALFFALSGSAYALQGKNTVDSGDIKNGQVKTADVANDKGKGALKGADIAANTLTGKDISEGSLGQVPSAQDAGTLDGLGSSAFLRTNGKAADADHLDGHDSGDFVPAGVLRSGRRTIDDPDPGDAGAIGVNVVETSSFQLQVGCAQNVFGTNDESADVSPFTASDSDISVSAWNTGHASGQPPAATNAADVSTGIEILDLQSTTHTVRSVYLIATAPNGDVMSGTVSAEVDNPADPGSDCTFSWNVLVS